MSLQNNRFRAEMKVNPFLQKVIAVYYITQVIGIIICVEESINSLLVYSFLSAIIPIILFIIFWVASNCKFHGLLVILVHYNIILSTIWFLSLLHVYCFLNQNLVMYSYYSKHIVDARFIIFAVVTGILSLSSVIVGVIGILRSARRVVLIARSGECGPVKAV